MRPCRPGPMTKTAHLVVLRVGPRRVPDRHACSGVRFKGRRCGDCGASHQIVWYQAGFRRKAFSSATEKRNGRTCARRYCLRQCRRGRRPQTKKLSQGRETPCAGTHQPGWLRSGFMLHRRSDNSSFETYTLSLDAARLKARDILDRAPASGQLQTVEGWRQLADGQIEFTMRRWPASD